MQDMAQKETTDEGIARRIKQLMLEHIKSSGSSGGGAPTINPESVNIEVIEIRSGWAIYQEDTF